jgi:hypothetical protein
MDELPDLRETVVFELPSFVDVKAFCDRLGGRWLRTAAMDGGQVWLITAAFEADATDLAALLREVEAYVADAGLHALRYCIDERFYVMGASPRVCSDAA